MYRVRYRVCDGAPAHAVVRLPAETAVADRQARAAVAALARVTATSVTVLDVKKRS